MTQAELAWVREQLERERSRSNSAIHTEQRRMMMELAHTAQSTNQLRSQVFLSLSAKHPRLFDWHQGLRAAPPEDQRVQSIAEGPCTPVAMHSGVQMQGGGRRRPFRHVASMEGR